MEFVSPPPTVRRNPPRRAKTPAPIPPETLAPARRPPLRSIHPNLQQNEASDLEKKPKQKKRADPAPKSDTIHVFLRIRPPKREALKKRSGEANPGNYVEAEASCLATNDSGSVVLKVPPSIADPKRLKSEIFDGFSSVFSPQSSQVEVYERVMQPLVMDFLGGSSRLLVVMGPTGTGKTHTVFGSTEEPGLVPLALKELFRHNSTYYMSMFEICSDRGRGERIFDLFQGGSELVLQQSSTVKGLHEEKLMNIKQAEFMIVHGMARRTTAETNANNQSSRSQCIINIRKGSEMIVEGDGSSDAVLTIADLAGTERERRTGIQGKRLLESGFINNTSMVLGICLRALLEHQQNKKKQLQMHFHGSLLTRYLREYLEAKKRMSLILTAGGDENDYNDTSFLLRQASPYTRIRFDPVKESTIISNKRHAVTLNKFPSSKRRRHDDIGPITMEKSSDEDPERDSCSADEHQLIKEPGEASCILMADQSKPHKHHSVNSLYNPELKRTRMEHIMQKFARALWTVLKEYKEKLMASENELQNLRRSFEREQTRSLKLEKQLQRFQASCSCLKGSMSKSDPTEVNNTSGICCTGSFVAAGTMANASHDLFAREDKEDNMLNVDHMSLSCSTCMDVADIETLPANLNASFGQSHDTSVSHGRVAIGELKPTTEIGYALPDANENDDRTVSSNAVVPKPCLLTTPVDTRPLEMGHVAHDTCEGSVKGTVASTNEVLDVSGNFFSTTRNNVKLLEVQPVGDAKDQYNNRTGDVVPVVSEPSLAFCSDGVIDLLCRDEKASTVDHAPLSCSTCMHVDDIVAKTDTSFGHSHMTSVLHALLQHGGVAIGEPKPTTEIDYDLTNANESDDITALGTGSSNAAVPVISQPCLLAIPVDMRPLEMEHVADDTCEDCDKGTDSPTKELSEVSGKIFSTTPNDVKLLVVQPMGDDKDQSNDRIRDAHLVPVVSQPSLALSTDSVIDLLCTDANISKSVSTPDESVGPVGRLLEELTGITSREFCLGLWENDEHCMSKISALSDKYGNNFERMAIDVRCSLDESDCLRCCFVLIHDELVQNEGKISGSFSRKDSFHAITRAPSVSGAMQHVRVLETKKDDHRSSIPSDNTVKPKRRLLPASSILKHNSSFNMDCEEDGIKDRSKRIRGHKYTGTQGQMELIRLLKGSHPM